MQWKQPREKGNGTPAEEFGQYLNEQPPQWSEIPVEGKGALILRAP